MASAFRRAGIDNDVVVVVDDDDGCREMLQLVLEAAGHRTAVAASGREAVELVRSLATVALVLLDWVLPGERGTEVLEEIRRATGHSVPVVVTTGLDGVVPPPGASGVLLKPFGADELLEMVERYTRAEAA